MINLNGWTLHFWNGKFYDSNVEFLLVANDDQWNLMDASMLLMIHLRWMFDPTDIRISTIKYIFGQSWLRAMLKDQIWRLSLTFWNDSIGAVLSFLSLWGHKMFSSHVMLSRISFREFLNIFSWAWYLAPFESDLRE